MLCVQLTASAPYNSFSEAILAPVTKVDWEPACRESYLATAEVKVYEHLAWGLPGTTKLVEEQTFEFAGLEFGEDLRTEASANEGEKGEEGSQNTEASENEGGGRAEENPQKDAEQDELQLAPQ